MYIYTFYIYVYNNTCIYLHIYIRKGVPGNSEAHNFLSNYNFHKNRYSN